MRPNSLPLQTEWRGLSRSVTVVSPAKTAEPIEMPFGFRTWVGQRNHVIDGRPDAPWKGAILRVEERPNCKVSGHCDELRKNG